MFQNYLHHAPEPRSGVQPGKGMLADALGK